MSSIDFFDPNFPRYGEAVNSESIRKQFNNVATDNAGDTVPSISATIIGDRLLSTLNLTSAPSLDIEIDGTRLTVDASTQAVSPGSTTVQEMVDSINDAFFDNGGFSDPVAFVFNPNSDSSSGFIMLKAPSTGSTSTITLRSISGTTDGEPQILGVSGRGINFPYTVTGVDLPKGYKWYRTSNSDDEEQQVYINSPGFVVGQVDLSGSQSVVERRNLRIRIEADEGTFGPLDIDISGASVSATTGAEIVANINSAFTGEPGWPSATGPASLVTRDGAGSYLKIVSGPADAPSVGINAQVVLSEPVSGEYIKDDGAQRLLGLPLGRGSERYSSLPHTFIGATFSDRHIRGLNNRRGAGIGVWGVPLERKEEIPENGVVDGEIRIDAAEGIGWIYKEGATSADTGWFRITPGFEYPISYDPETESYTIASASDSYLPEPLQNQNYPDTSFLSSNTLAGVVSQIPTLVDARSSSFPNVLYPKKTWESGNPRNLHLPKPRFDDFTTFGALGTVNLSLVQTVDGGSWEVDSALDDSLSIASGNDGMLLGALGASTEEQRAFHKNSPGYLVRCLTPVNGSNTQFSCNLKDLAEVTTGSPNSIIPSSVRAYLGTYSTTGGAAVDYPEIKDITTLGGGLEVYDIRDNGAGNLTSGLLTATPAENSIDYSTGEFIITFSSAPPTGADRFIFISFSLSSNFLIVSAEFRKSDGSISEIGTETYAGLAYKGVGTIGINTDTGYFVKVFDDGNGQLSKRTNTGSETVLTTFKVDPNLNTEFRTLRVVTFRNGSGGRQHQIYWNGSNKSTDWASKENDDFLPAVLPAFATSGGKEIRRNKSTLVASYLEETEDPNLVDGVLCGIVSFAAKPVYINRWQAHGGWEQNVLAIKPGLPPVSGAKVRDTINAVQVSGENGTFEGGIEGIITDCDPKDPLLIEPQDPLFAFQETGNRKIILGSNWNPTSHTATRHDTVVGLAEGLVDMSAFGTGANPTIFDQVGAQGEIVFNDIDYDAANFNYVPTITPRRIISDTSNGPSANGGTSINVTFPDTDNAGFYWDIDNVTVDSIGGKARVRFVVKSGGWQAPVLLHVSLFYVRNSG